MQEFTNKSKDYMMDESISEVNGREVLKVNQWVKSRVQEEIEEVGKRFEEMFNNVNY